MLFPATTVRSTPIARLFRAFALSIPFALHPRMRTNRRSLVRKPEKGAAGKALLVWLLSGSGIVAIVAFIIFKVAGC